MDYKAYKDSLNRIDDIESEIARLSVELIQEEKRLYNSQKIGFRMGGKGSGRKNMPPGPGRPKGSKNKTDARLREAIAQILEGQIENVEHALNRLYEEEKYRDFLGILVRYVERVVSKPKHITIDGDLTTGPKKIGFKDESESE